MTKLFLNNLTIASSKLNLNLKRIEILKKNFYSREKYTFLYFHINSYRKFYKQIIAHKVNFFKKIKWLGPEIFSKNKSLNIKDKTF